MIINPSLPGGYTVFCDDVRHEVTKKVTLVGVYANYMFLAEFPALLPKFVCMITYREEPDKHGPVVIKLTFEPKEGEEAVISELAYEVTESETRPKTDEFVMREARFYFEITPLVLSGPGRLKVRAFRDSDVIKLGALHVAIPPEVGAPADEIRLPAKVSTKRKSPRK